MKSLLSVAVFAGIVGILPYAYGAGVTGTWKGAFDYQGSTVPLTLHLTEAGDVVTGNIEGLPTTPTEIHDGKVESGKLSFWANTDYQGETYKLVFTGELSSAADAITFTMGTDDGDWSTEVEARKSSDPDPASPQEKRAQTPPLSPQNLTGVWSGSFEFQGQQVPVAMHLAVVGQTVTGMVKGDLKGGPQRPLDIQEGKLLDGKMSFWIKPVYQGKQYKIVFNGTVADGKIDFIFGTQDGSWSHHLSMTR